MKTVSGNSSRSDAAPHLIQVAADLNAIRSIGPWLQQLLVAHADMVAGLELALQELAVNIIEHGYGATAVGDADVLTVSGQVTEKHVTIVVVDGAAVFSGDIDEQAGRAKAGELSVGGFGLMIIEQITDEFHHSPLPERGNEWTLVCRID